MLCCLWANCNSSGPEKLADLSKIVATEDRSEVNGHDNDPGRGVRGLLQAYQGQVHPESPGQTLAPCLCQV